MTMEQMVRAILIQAVWDDLVVMNPDHRNYPSLQSVRDDELTGCANMLAGFFDKWKASTTVPPAQSSDLQSRLRGIERRVNAIRLADDDGKDNTMELAEQIEYLAMILRKHLETGER